MSDTKEEAQPVFGNRPQSPEAVAAVTLFKHIEEQVLQLLDAMKTDEQLTVDQRWLAAGRTQVEQGFMSITRAIFKPERFELPYPSVAELAMEEGE